MPYSAIRHTGECTKHSENIFSNLHLITSHKNQMKLRSVKHQYYNKVIFLQLSAYKTNKPLFAYLSRKINKKKINLAKTH